MKAYNYSEARKRLSEVLDIAKNEEVLIKRRGGEVFSLILKKSSQSPAIRIIEQNQPINVSILSLTIIIAHRARITG